MTYTGNVTVGGPADVRELTDLAIAKVAVGAMDNNAYLLTCRQSGEQCLIDAAADADRLLTIVDTRRLASIVTTHRHRDHWEALQPVVAATTARTAAGRNDVPGIGVPTDLALDDGNLVRVGAVDLAVISLTGHTPGSIALRYDDPDGVSHVFTGDSLFPGGLGNTHRDPAAFDSLYEDVTVKIFDQLPDDTWIYPGHGADTTLGRERPALAEWRERGW